MRFHAQREIEKDWEETKAPFRGYVVALTRSRVLERRGIDVGVLASGNHGDILAVVEVRVGRIKYGFAQWHG